MLEPIAGKKNFDILMVFEGLFTTYDFMITMWSDSMLMQEGKLTTNVL